jgi:hypothetical protein
MFSQTPLSPPCLLHSIFHLPFPPTAILFYLINLINPNNLNNFKNLSTMSPSGLRTTRSSTRFLGSTLPSIPVDWIPIKRRSISPADYEDYGKKELNSKPARTGKRSSGVSR